MSTSNLCRPMNSIFAPFSTGEAVRIIHFCANVRRTIPGDMDPHSQPEIRENHLLGVPNLPLCASKAISFAIVSSTPHTNETSSCYPGCSAGWAPKSAIYLQEALILRSVPHVAPQILFDAARQCAQTLTLIEIWTNPFQQYAQYMF